MQFLQSPTVARGIIIFIQWWMWFWAAVVLLMAGMTAIPESLYESAMMDGATEGQMFRYITLPLLKPILVYLFVTSLVGGMQMFDIPYQLKAKSLLVMFYLQTSCHRYQLSYVRYLDGYEHWF